MKIILFLAIVILFIGFMYLMPVFFSKNDEEEIIIDEKQISLEPKVFSCDTDSSECFNKQIKEITLTFIDGVHNIRRILFKSNSDITNFNVNVYVSDKKYTYKLVDFENPPEDKYKGYKQILVKKCNVSKVIFNNSDGSFINIDNPLLTESKYAICDKDNNIIPTNPIPKKIINLGSLSQGAKVFPIGYENINNLINENYDLTNQFKSKDKLFIQINLAKDCILDRIVFNKPYIYNTSITDNEILNDYKNFNNKTLRIKLFYKGKILNDFYLGDKDYISTIENTDKGTTFTLQSQKIRDKKIDSIRIIPKDTIWLRQIEIYGSEGDKSSPEDYPVTGKYSNYLFAFIIILVLLLFSTMNV